MSRKIESEKDGGGKRVEGEMEDLEEMEEMEDMR